MEPYKTELLDFLAEIHYGLTDKLMQRLQVYLDALYDANQLVNMVSRKMSKDMYWTHHFLDSLIVLNCMDFTGKSIMDFGTGGGLPLLPIKLAVSDTKIILLDATNRKIDALKGILRTLGYPEELAVCARMEDYSALEKRPMFDYVLCRAVAMEPRYAKPLYHLLKPGGKVIFYKAQKVDDLLAYACTTEYETQHKVLGYRRIMSIAKKDLKI